MEFHCLSTVTHPSSSLYARTQVNASVFVILFSVLGTCMNMSCDCNCLRTCSKYMFYLDDHIVYGFCSYLSHAKSLNNRVVYRFQETNIWRSWLTAHNHNLCKQESLGRNKI